MPILQHKTTHKTTTLSASVQNGEFTNVKGDEYERPEHHRHRGRHLADNSPAGRYRPGGGQSVSIACSADGTYLVAAHSGTHELSVIDRPALHKAIDTAVASGVGLEDDRFRAQRRSQNDSRGTRRGYPRSLRALGWRFEKTCHLISPLLPCPTLRNCQRSSVGRAAHS